MAQHLVSMPYKIGDALWSLPIAKAIAKKTGTPVDFATSEYTKPLHTLIQFQSYIDQLIVDERFDKFIGGNMRMTWNLALPFEGYESQTHIRFPQFPHKHLPEFFADLAGVQLAYPLSIDYPEPTDPPFPSYIAVNSTEHNSVPTPIDTAAFFSAIIENSPLPVVQIGASRDAIDVARTDHLNLCGKDLLKTSTVLAGAKLLISMPSANPTLGSLVGTPQLLLLPSDFMLLYNQVFQSLGDVWIAHPDRCTAEQLAEQTATLIYSLE